MGSSGSLHRSQRVCAIADFPAPAPPRSHSMGGDIEFPLCESLGVRAQESRSSKIAVRVSGWHLGGSNRSSESQRALNVTCCSSIVTGSASKSWSYNLRDITVISVLTFARNNESVLKVTTINRGSTRILEHERR
jgi:hypothetical protein